MWSRHSLNGRGSLKPLGSWSLAFFFFFLISGFLPKYELSSWMDFIVGYCEGFFSVFCS